MFLCERENLTTKLPKYNSYVSNGEILTIQ